MSKREGISKASRDRPYPCAGSPRADFPPCRHDGLKLFARCKSESVRRKSCPQVPFRLFGCGGSVPLRIRDASSAKAL